MRPAGSWREDRGPAGRRRRMLGGIVGLMCLLATVSARADAFGDLLAEALAGHDRIKAAEAAVEAAENRARAAFAPLYPTLDTTASYGFEHQSKPDGDANTNATFHEIDLELTQLLWDFGASYASIERARLQLSDTQVALVAARQDMIQNAAAAYVDLRRAALVLDFARRSESNILDTTGLEEARVEAGGGLSTDVLQAKTQLAEAEARRIAAEGALRGAENRFVAVFGHLPEDPRGLPPIGIDEARLPETLDDALTQAVGHNTDLQRAALAESIARQDMVRSSRDGLLPTIEAVGQQTWKRDVSGTMGFKGETLAKVELSFPFNLGFTAVNTLRAAEADLAATSRRMGDTRRDVEERVRNAWHTLQTARATVQSRETQASLSEAFLELAREERGFGQRSLIDVLSGETSLINALSESANARSAALRAALDLLRVIGHLSPDVFTTPPDPDERLPAALTGGAR